MTTFSTKFKNQFLAQIDTLSSVMSQPLLQAVKGNQKFKKTPRFSSKNRCNYWNNSYFTLPRNKAH